MTESYYLLIATFIPLLVSPIAYVLGKKRGGNVTTWFSFGILAISTMLLFLASFNLQGGRTSYEESYAWSQFGNFGLRIDGLSLPFAIIINILCTVLTVYSKPYMLHKIKESFEENSGKKENATDSGEYKANAGGNEIKTLIVSKSSEEQYINHHMGLYFALYLIFSMGMLGTVLATNLIEFYVFFELMLVPSFFLLAFYGYGERKRIALMFFFWTHVGAVVLLLGLLAMGFFAGGFDYDTVMQNVDKITDQWIVLIVFALVVGLGVKLAAFALHIWLPYAHSEAPTPISALLSPAMIGIGAYGLLRLWLELLVGDYSQYSIYINLWGLATMIYGGAMAMMQDDIKRVLAYSSISQMGYILFGIGSESVLGITGATFMYITHGLGKAILFMMAGSIILQTGTRSMSKLGGLAGRMPYTAVIAMIGALTIMGIPPTSGFMGEWILFNGVLQSGLENSDTLRIAVFGLGILATVLTAAYILWMYKRIFLGKIPEQYAKIKDSNRYVIVPMAALAAITLFLGVYPIPMLNPITDYVQEMFTGDNTVLQFSTANPVNVSSSYMNSSNSHVTVTGGES